MKANNNSNNGMVNSNSTDSEKIIHIIQKLGAKDFESAVTLRQVVDYGIKYGFTEDYPRGREDGHPWWPHTSVMMGVGQEEQVAEYEELHLHRRKISIKEKGKRATTTMVYWFDPNHDHEVISRSSKKIAEKVVEPKILSEKKINMTDEEMNSKMLANPGKFRKVNGRLISEEWIAANPEKFAAIYK